LKAIALLDSKLAHNRFGCIKSPPWMLSQ
jgi:hypothetical protein